MYYYAPSSNPCDVGKNPSIWLPLYTTQILANVNVMQHLKMWVLFPLLFTVASEYRN